MELRQQLYVMPCCFVGFPETVVVAAGDNTHFRCHHVVGLPSHVPDDVAAEWEWLVTLP